MLKYVGLGEKVVGAHGYVLLWPAGSFSTVRLADILQV